MSYEENLLIFLRRELLKQIGRNLRIGIVSFKKEEKVWIMLYRI